MKTKQKEIQDKVSALIRHVAKSLGFDEIEVPKVYFRKGMTRTAGYTSYRLGAIVLSSHYHSINEKKFNQIIIHEALHWISYEIYGEAGHGPAWQLMCVYLGIKPKLTYTF